MMRRRAFVLALCLGAGSAWADPGSAREALAAALQARHPGISRFELTPLSEKHIAAAAVEVPEELALDKRVRVWAIASDKDGKARRTPSWWAVKAFAPVMVARRALRAGEQVRPGDLSVEERDVAGAGETLLAADPGVESARWRATRFVQAGALLRRADLEPAPQVLRGQQIRVSVVAETFTIETTGIAAGEGRLGDVIAVSKPGTPERYFAEVTGERQVLIRGEP